MSTAMTDIFLSDNGIFFRIWFELEQGLNWLLLVLTYPAYSFVA